jgi:DNA gyrase/topoisomerase IV subunit A
VKSFQKYYPLLGIPIPNDEALRLRLRQAIKNSRDKRYHGNDENMNQIPKLEEQAKTYLEEKVKPFEHFEEEKKVWLSAEDPLWKKSVLDKFPWIRSLHANTAAGEEKTPRDYALLADEDSIDLKDITAIKNKGDQLRLQLQSVNVGSHMTTVGKTTVVEDYPATFTWRDLFLKLCFEQML